MPSLSITSGARTQDRARNAVPELRRSDGLGRSWESPALAMLEDGWLVLIWNGLMHHRGVPVTLHVLLASLHSATPSNIAALHAGLFPNVTLEMFLCTHSVLMAMEGNKRVAETREALEVGGNIDKAVSALEALFVQDPQEVCADV